MNRNPRDKHLKRHDAPKHWMLDKLSGVWAPRPSAGPHKLRECLPIVIMLRNRLKYALTAREVKMIVKSRHIRVDGKVRTDTKFPCGLMDVVTINRTGEHFRLIYDTKGRFHLNRIPVSDANWKLLKVTKKAVGSRGIPYIVTHDGRTIPYPNPAIHINDTIQYDFVKGKIEKIYPFDLGTVIMVIGGRNVGRVGILEKMEKHPGAFDIVYIRDAADHVFATRKNNIFIIGKGTTPAIRLTRRKGVKLGVVEDREARMMRAQHPVHNQNDKKKYAGKGKIVPAHVTGLREKTREKKRLLKILRQQEKASGKGKKKKTKKAPAASE